MTNDLRLSLHSTVGLGETSGYEADKIQIVPANRLPSRIKPMTKWELDLDYLNKYK